jgi:hypothetical protein
VNPDENSTHELAAVDFKDEIAELYEDFDEVHSVSSSETDDDVTDSIVHDDIVSRLAQWALQYSISMNSLSALLEILKPYHAALPKDPRKLLKTVSCAEINPLIRKVSNGSYYHFGIECGVCQCMEDTSATLLIPQALELSVSLQINVDGVPLFKSTNGQFWPVLGKLCTPVVSEPFVIGVYYGLSKPDNLEFLSDFVKESLALQSNGIKCLGYSWYFSISAVICDAPARAFLKNVKGHNAYHGCERCTQVGVWNGKMTFPSVNAPKRSNVAFNELLDSDHHLGQSPLNELGIGMVSQFVLDYMHLVCLGVVRRLIWLWIKGPLRANCRIKSSCVSDISEKLIGMKSFIPREFARKPRSLLEWQR